MIPSALETRTEITPCGSSTLRIVECLQVGPERFIIDIRPAPAAVGGRSACNKWMNAEHWDELYKLLRESAGFHSNAAEKYYKALKAQGPLLKVLYQFLPFASCYKDVVSTYSFTSAMPQMALLSGVPFLSSELHCDVLVAVVFPCEYDVSEFDSFPTYLHKGLLPNEFVLSLPSNDGQDTTNNTRLSNSPGPQSPDMFDDAESDTIHHLSAVPTSHRTGNGDSDGTSSSGTDPQLNVEHDGLKDDSHSFQSGNVLQKSQSTNSVPTSGDCESETSLKCANRTKCVGYVSSVANQYIRSDAKSDGMSLSSDDQRCGTLEKLANAIHEERLNSSEEVDLPSTFEADREAVTKKITWETPTSSDSDSADELAPGTGRNKRRRKFSKFQCERKTCEDIQSSVSDSEKSNAGSKSDVSVPTSSAGDAVELGKRRLRLRNIFGRVKSVRIPVTPPEWIAGTTAHSSNAKPSEKTASELGDCESSQPKRSSPRKVGKVSCAEREGKKPDTEPSDAAAKRTSPRKKARQEFDVKREANEGQDENQMSLPAKRSASEQIEDVGGKESRKRTAGEKRPNTQKRVGKNVAAKESKKLKDGSCSKYFATSVKKSVEPITSASTCKSGEGKNVEASSDVSSPSKDSKKPSNDTKKCVVTQSQKNDTENARCMDVIANLTPDTISKSFKKHSYVFHDIFMGRFPSKRHELYKTNLEKRAVLRFSAENGLFSNEQLSHMLSLLTKAFCRDNAVQFMDYMWKVLVPEFATRVFMDAFSLGYDESQGRILELYHFCTRGSD